MPNRRKDSLAALEAPLSEQQRRFCHAYVDNGGNGSRAAAMAGYAPDKINEATGRPNNTSSVTASRMLKNEDVTALIAFLMQRQFISDAPAAAKSIKKLATSAEKENVQLAAAKDVLDRAGLSAINRTQTDTTVEHVLSIDLDQAMAEVGRILGRSLAPPQKVIDITPTMSSVVDPEPVYDPEAEF